MRTSVACAFAALVVAGVAGSSVGGLVVPNQVVVVERIFNDYPDSILVVNNDFPLSVQFDESHFGMGGFANRHSAYFSTDGGATIHDFGYHDAFDIKIGMQNESSPPDGREAGFHADLFGFGFFGALPHNGEIAAFGSIFPFYSFGTGLWTPGDSIGLRIIHRPGEGDGINPLPDGARPSTIEYLWDPEEDGTYFSSGEIPFTNMEGGIPENFEFRLGFGVQNQGAPGGQAYTQFGKFIMPSPTGVTLLGLGGLVALRRRR